MVQDLERFLNGQPVEANAPDPNATVRTAQAAGTATAAAATSLSHLRQPPRPLSHAGRLGDVLRVNSRNTGADVRLAIAGILLFILIYFGPLLSTWWARRPATSDGPCCPAR